MEKLRVAFIYKKTSIIMNGKYYCNNHYHFFMNALKRNNRINVTYFPSENIFDTSVLRDNFDIILLFQNYNVNTPDDLLGIHETNIPVISGIVDPHHDIPREIFHEKYNINCYFSIIPENLFYEIYPRHYKYKTIHYGVELSLYKNLLPYNKRIKNKILNSGAVANMTIPSRIISKIRNPKGNAYNWYKLRTLCNKLPYVDYTSTLQHEYVGDKYPLLLQKYATAIAATTLAPTMKYYEIPSAGCLTFMEITEKNNGKFLGFRDYETAIFINEENYKEKFNEYLDDLDNPKWEKIANAGREFALNNFNNDVAVDKLVDLMEELI